MLGFFKRHELVQMIPEGEVRTFSGSQNTTRRPVPLHSPGDKASHLTIIWQGEATVSSPVCSAPKGSRRPRQHPYPNPGPATTN